MTTEYIVQVGKPLKQSGHKTQYVSITDYDRSIGWHDGSTQSIAALAVRRAKAAVAFTVLKIESQVNI